MKPLVIYDLEKYYSDDYKILTTKERFEQILEEVYEAGVADATKGNYTFPYSPGIRTQINPVEVTYMNDEVQTAVYNANKASSY